MDRPTMAQVHDSLNYDVCDVCEKVFHVDERAMHPCFIPRGDIVEEVRERVVALERADRYVTSLTLGERAYVRYAAELLRVEWPWGLPHVACRKMRSHEDPAAKVHDAVFLYSELDFLRQTFGDLRLMQELARGIREPQSLIVSPETLRDLGARDWMQLETEHGAVRVVSSPEIHGDRAYLLGDRSCVRVRNDSDLFFGLDRAVSPRRLETESLDTSRAARRARRSRKGGKPTPKGGSNR